MSAGRKSYYEERVAPYFEDIKKWRIAGQTEENIAKLLKVSFRALTDYKGRYPEFAKLLRDSTNVLVGELENTMFQMALGKIKVKEVKKFISRNKEGKDSTKIEETVKELAPNPTLLIFSLKNLAPDRWRDVQDVTFNDMENAMKNMDTVFSEMKEKLDKSEDGKITLEIPSDEQQ